MEAVVHLKNISKTYPEKTRPANDNVDLILNKGEILCLAGENGAGKTTLMKILYGMVQPDSGTIAVMGQTIKIDSPLIANKLGIGMVHQHFMLVEEFTVAQNVTMGIEPRWGLFYDDKTANKKVQQIISQHHFSIDSQALVKSLTVGQKQQVEIVKMLYRNVDILILDEPTAVLTEQEIDALFLTLGELVKNGKSLILITHKLHEIKAFSNRVAVMRQGKMIGSYETATLDEREISRIMMGEAVDLSVDKGLQTQKQEEVIVFDDVSVIRRGQERPILNKVSFSALSGEILGFAGVGGNGLGVLEAVLGGFLPVSSGCIRHKDKDITNIGSEALRKQGLAYVPADRLGVGSAIQASVQENVIVSSRSLFSKKGVIDRKKMYEHTETMLNTYSVKGSPQVPIGTLSGGNIQKVLLSREIGQYKDYIVFSEPTWGLDVASSKFVYEQMVTLRNSGAAVIVISSNLDEILAISDRVIIFYRGSIVAMMAAERLRSISKEIIGEYMLGLRKDNVYARQ